MHSDGRGPGGEGGGLRIGGREEAAHAARLPSSRPPRAVDPPPIEIGRARDVKRRLARLCPLRLDGLKLARPHGWRPTLFQELRRWRSVFRAVYRL